MNAGSPRSRLKLASEFGTAGVSSSRPGVRGARTTYIATYVHTPILRSAAPGTGKGFASGRARAQHDQATPCDPAASRRGGLNVGRAASAADAGRESRRLGREGRKAKGDAAVRVPSTFRPSVRPTIHSFIRPSGRPSGRVSLHSLARRPPPPPAHLSTGCGPRH